MQAEIDDGRYVLQTQRAVDLVWDRTVTELATAIKDDTVMEVRLGLPRKRSTSSR